MTLGEGQAASVVTLTLSLSVYLDVELDVDHPDSLACGEAPDPDGGILAAGDHQL